jgi:hypothetical protein
VSDRWVDSPVLYRAVVISAYGTDRVKVRHENNSGAGWGYRRIISADELHDDPLLALKAYKCRLRASIKSLRADLKTATKNLTVTPTRDFNDT